jgi:amphi-Trp domain-containing protein
MAKKDAIEFNDTVAPEEAAKFLEAIAKSLRKGSSLLESGDQSLGLAIGKTVKLEIGAESDPIKGKGSIEVSLSWRMEEQAAPPPSLVIVPGAPVPASSNHTSEE